MKQWLLLLCCLTTTASAWTTGSATREYRAGEEHRIAEAGHLMCHEMLDEAAVGHARGHILWKLEYYYAQLKKHPRDYDLRTKIRILESALKYPECGIAIPDKIVYSVYESAL